MNFLSAKFVANSNGWTDLEQLSVSCSQTILSTEPNAYVGIYRNNKPYKLVHVFADDEYSCFQNIKFIADKLVIGFGESVHFINLETKDFLSIKLDGYFSEMYLPEDFKLSTSVFHLLVASSNSLYHFDFNGKELWKSELLGIDGVIVHHVKPPIIEVSGECNPPDGWEERTLNLKDGSFIT